MTSTKPSLRLVSSLRQTGKVAWPDCFRTLGALGAVSSFSMVHFSWPVPVLVAVQPGSGAPVLRLSKFTVSANAMAASIIVGNTAATLIGRTPFLSLVQRHANVERRALTEFAFHVNRAPMHFNDPF